MRGARVLTLAVAVLAGACSSGGPKASDSTLPPEPTGDCVLERAPGGAAGSWSVSTDRALGAPVVDGGRVYIGVNAPVGAARCVYALDAPTGEPLWVRPGAISVGAAPLPVADLVVTSLAPARLLGLDVGTGEVRWRSPELGGFFVRPPLLVNGVLVVVTDSALIGLDPASGAEKWRFAQSPLGAEVGPAGAFATFGAEDRTARFIPESGSGIWSTSLGARTAVVKAVAATVAVAQDAPNTLFGLAADDGKLLWERNIDGAKNSPLAVAGDELYFSADDGKGYRVDARTGAVAWTVTTGSAVMTPVVTPRVVVFAVGGPEPALIGIDRASGAERWRRPAPARLTSAPQLVAGRIVVGTQKGDLCRVGVEDGVASCTFVGGAQEAIDQPLAVNGAQVIARVGERRVVSLPG